MSAQGYPIVLTADRTLTARYDLLFDGMLAASTTTTTPGFLTDNLLMPTVNGSRGRCSRAPLGLRRIEAALLGSGFSPDDVATVDEARLSSAVGPATRIIGISSGEPLGRGMNSSTMTAVAGGRIVPHDRFRRLLGRVRSLISGRAPDAKIVLGGPGAWQMSEDKREAAGIDHVVVGYAEANIAEVFRDILRGKPLAHVIEGGDPRPEDIPPITAPSTMGAIEISRGCGLGCHFCTIARRPMTHLPEGTILNDVRVNISGGQNNLALLSEDFFRYGGKGVRVNPGALIDLIQKIRSTSGTGLLQIDHANLSSVAQFGDSELSAIRDILTAGQPHDYLWVNVGVETASGRLLKECGGAAKLGGCEPDGWGPFCARQINRLMAAGFFPFVSLIIGLPGERAEDAARTLEWVAQFRHARLAIFPVIYAPVDGLRPPQHGRLTATHWELLRACYRLNFKWIPRLYWDNQAAAGVPLVRRALMRFLGTGQILQWWLLLRRNLLPTLQNESGTP